MKSRVLYVYVNNTFFFLSLRENRRTAAAEEVGNIKLETQNVLLCIHDWCVVYVGTSSSNQDASTPLRARIAVQAWLSGSPVELGERLRD